MFHDFYQAWREIFTRAPSLPVTLYPRIVVDMGAKEQSEVRTTVETEFQSLAPLLRRFEQKFRIRLSVEPRIDASALVNPFDSSIVVADGVRERRSIREDKIATSDPRTAVIYGLAALLENVRGHAAPRDDVDYDQGALNKIGSTFLALQDDGQLVSSVGPNSLMDLKDSTTHLWAVDPAFWAVTHGTPARIANAYNTQYTARYHSPQMLRLLVESQLEWLLQNPRELSNLSDATRRAKIQKTIIEERLFAKLQDLYGQHRGLMRELNPGFITNEPKIVDITDKKSEAIPTIPDDIITHNDDYKILGIYVPRDKVDQIAKPGASVYVAIETRKYVPVDTPTAAGARLERVPVTLLAERTDAVFSGRNGTLTLAPCVHNDAGDKATSRVKLNLFVQMSSASNPEDGFHPSGAAGGLFENEGGYIAVGHKVYAVVEKSLIDPLIKTVCDKESVDPAKVTPNLVITYLVEKGLVSYIDSSKLRGLSPDSQAFESLVDNLADKACRLSIPAGRFVSGPSSRVPAVA